MLKIRLLCIDPLDARPSHIPAGSMQFRFSQSIITVSRLESGFDQIECTV